MRISGSLENYGELIFEDFVNFRLSQDTKFEKCYIICFQTIILVCQPMTTKNSSWAAFKDPGSSGSLKLWFKKSFPVNLLVSQANQAKVDELKAATDLKCPRNIKHNLFGALIFHVYLDLLFKVIIS